MFIASIDCGTTNFKAAVFDERLNRQAEYLLPTPYTIQNPDRAEMDPAAIRECAHTVLMQACRAAAIAPRLLHRISLTSQAQTFAVFAAGGRALTPFICWTDRRALTEAEEINRMFGAAFKRFCSFAAPLPQMMFPKVLWLQRQQPQGIPSDAILVQLPSYCAMQFGAAHVLDRNLAAMCGFYSIPAAAWHSQTLAMAGIHAAQLPSLVNPGASVPVHQPACAARIDLDPRVEIVMACNDQTAGGYGNQCGHGKLVVTLGTALVAYRHAGLAPGPFGAAAAWGPYPDGGYYEMAVGNAGCAALDWACQRLSPHDPSALIRAAEKGLQRTNAQHPSPVLFYPDRIGSDRAWTLCADLESMGQAVLEGITFRLRQLVTEEFPRGICWDQLQVTGGGSQNPHWLQLVANVLNCPVRRTGGDALLGAAMMALPSIAPPQELNPAEFRPDPAGVRRYALRYPEWRRHR